LGIATQVPALQKPPVTQEASLVQVVPHVGGDPGEQRNPLQLVVIPVTQVPVPLQTFVMTIALPTASQAGVLSQTTDEAA
jgi:hypothetical protein